MNILNVYLCSVLKSISDGNSGRLSKLLGRKTHFKGEDLSGALLKAVRLGQERCITQLLAAGTDYVR